MGAGIDFREVSNAVGSYNDIYFERTKEAQILLKTTITQLGVVE